MKHRDGGGAHTFVADLTVREQVTKSVRPQQSTQYERDVK